MEWTVREATPEDASTVREIARESWHAAYDEFLGADRVERVTDEWYAVADLESSIAEASDHEDATFPLAVSASDDCMAAGPAGPNSDDCTAAGSAGSNAVCGFAHAGVVADADSGADADSEVPADIDITVLSRLYVRPAQWGNGAGTALLERVEAALGPTADRLRLTVLADNEIGISFYESAGFDRVAVRETDLVAGLEEYDYEKPIADSSR